MPKKVEDLDQYIENAPDFAKPIIRHIRQLVHTACPEVVETFKWGHPSFEHKGVFCSMGAFKQHCTFGFWKASLLTDPYNILNKADLNAAGQIGRIETLDDLPADEIMIAYLKEAAKLNEEGQKVTKAKPKNSRVELEIPDYFQQALEQNEAAMMVFEKFSPSSKGEYIEWLSSAKSEKTRNERMATALEWIAEGKTRHWKYK